MAYDALVAFYATNTYPPCPADGALTAADANYGGAHPETSGACAGVAAVNQVLPWRTLGLREELSFDGWRQRLSYRVSPPLTTAGAASPAISRCATVRWPCLAPQSSLPPPHSWS